MGRYTIHETYLIIIKRIIWIRFFFIMSTPFTLTLSFLLYGSQCPDIRYFDPSLESGYKTRTICLFDTGYLDRDVDAGYRPCMW